MLFNILYSYGKAATASEGLQKFRCIALMAIGQGEIFTVTDLL
jgi:hypothetical protein